MAINLTNAWTGSTIAPVTRAATPPAATTPGSNIPPAVTNAQQPLANQALINSLLSNLFGGGGRGSTTVNNPITMAPQQAQAINFAIQQIGAENWARQKEQDIRAFMDPRSRTGFEGVSPLFAPMGGGFLPVQNSVVNQFLSNARLAPAIALGSAAASFGSGGGAPIRTAPAPMGGWTSPGFGF